jgi:hypothetical protein
MNSTRVILAVILLAQFAMGMLYATRTPAWQAPDEPAHYNYVRALVENGAFPVLQPGDYNQQYLEKIKAAKFPPDMPIDSIRYEAHQPPLYYVLAAPVFLFARAMNFDAVLLLRYLNVALGVILSALAFLIFTRVFPTQPLLQLAGVGIIATLPMHLAMSAAINNDTLAEIIIAVILLFGILRVQGKLDDRRFFLLGGIAYGAALLTKTTIYSSIVLLVAAEYAYRRIQFAQLNSGAARGSARLVNRSMLVSGVKTLAPLFGIAFAIAGLWFVRNASVYGATDILGWTRHDLVVVGQPTTAQFIAQYGLRTVVFDFFAISFKSFWAQFGWMGVLVNDRMYMFLFVLSAAATFGALLWGIRLVRERKLFSAQARWTWVLLGTLLTLACAAHVYYNLKYVQPQGRYLFPGLVALAAFWAAGLYEIFNPRYARVLFALLYVVMLALDYIALVWFIVPQLSR